MLQDMRILDVGKWEANAITQCAATSLISNLGQLLNNEDYFPDITFLVEGKFLYLRTIITQACRLLYILSCRI